MFDIGWGELVLIGLVVLVVVGPEQIPELMRSIGRHIGQLRRLSSQFRSQLAIMDVDTATPKPRIQDDPITPKEENSVEEPDLFSSPRTKGDTRE